jgi:putative transcriptional regulator
MLDKTNNRWVAMSDRAIAGEIGAYIKENRLSLNQTQAQIAAKAGISRWTLSQLENGEPGTVLSLIQVLRAMDLLHVLDIFTTEQVISPIELAKMERRKRQRARGKGKGKQPESDW